MRKQKRQWSLAAGVIGVVAATLFLVLALVVPKSKPFGEVKQVGIPTSEWQRNNQEAIERMRRVSEERQKKQAELLARMDQSDRAALNEYIEWARLPHMSLYSEKVDGQLTYLLFVYEQPFKNVLVVDRGDTYKTIDLGTDPLWPLGVTSDNTFLFSKKFPWGAGEPCRDYGMYEADATGKVILRITENCVERGITSFTIHSDKNEDMSFVQDRGTGAAFENNWCVLNTATGTAFELYLQWWHDPRLDDRKMSEGCANEEVLRAFLAIGDRSSLAFPERDPYLGDTTTTLLLRPTPHLSAKATAINNCRSHWEGSIDAMRDGSKSAVAELEKCMSILKYPFKKFPIPGTSSYFGFMGNSTDVGSVRCQPYGHPNGCLLYKVERGVPQIMENDEQLPGITVLSAEADGSLFVYYRPQADCLSESYHAYDFVNGTTTRHVVEFEHGCTGWDTMPLITFYPKGVPIQIFVGGGIRSRDDANVATTLIFNEQELEVFSERAEGEAFTGGSFPRSSDIDTYVLQSDKTKFYFTAGSSSYTLDLAPEIPRLIKR